MSKEAYFPTTVVVLCYNNRSVTEKFMELFKANTTNYNLIIIDNGSSDGTVDYLNEIFPTFEGNAELILNQENLGVIGGRNQGFGEFLSQAPYPTKGMPFRYSEYLCFLDNDQFVRQGWLTQYHEFMQKGNYDMIGADAWLMDSKFMPRHNCSRAGESFTYVGCGGMMIKRKVVEDLKGFDPQFNPAYFEDPDYNFRAREKGYKIGWNYQARITHLPHQTLGKSNDRMKYFVQSFDRFKAKWKGKEFPALRQNPI